MLFCLISYLKKKEKSSIVKLCGADAEDRSSKSHPKQKKMESEDYQRVQIELQNQLNQVELTGDALHYQQGWSTHPLGKVVGS